MVFATPGKGKATLAAFKAFLEQHGGKPGRIVEVVCDMSDGPLTVRGKPSFHLHEADNFEILQTAPALMAAVRAGKHIVIQTEFVVTERGLRVLLEYPAKTINMNEERSAVQVDTGPMVFPDFSVTHDRHIDALRLCYPTLNDSGRC